MLRVVSKNLFNFPLTGEMNEEVKAMDAQMQQMMEASPEAKKVINRMKELEIKDDMESTMEFLALVRASSEHFIGAISQNPALNYGGEQTTTTFLKVPTSHDGEFDVPVEVYTPKELDNDTKKAAYIYAHGGGVIAFSAADLRKGVQCIAVEMNVVAFNVDYRLAPETKCPNNIKDFYEVIKYVSENAESLGIDPTKIVIAGESGGGYICLGAMVLLAQKEEGHLVKLAIPGVPMVDDYCFSDPLAMTLEERKAHLSVRKIWKDLVASDFEQQKNDPHLFPGKASKELLEKFPPTIILESEFDHFITEASRLANRLRRAGRLLEFVVFPGANHMSSYMPGTQGNTVLVDTMKTIVKEYVH